jgi:hypothetical protein
VSLISEYKQAFSRCYPHLHVAVRLKRVGPGDFKHRVIIQGDPGDILLTDEDLRSAIRLFMRGR